MPKNCPLCQQAMDADAEQQVNQFMNQVGGRGGIVQPIPNNTPATAGAAQQALGPIPNFNPQQINALRSAFNPIANWRPGALGILGR